MMFSKYLKYFDSRYKLRAHIGETFLTIVITTLAIAYFFTPGAIITRIRIMIPIVGAKSLIIQAYQLLTEHVTRLARWKSPKANAILNCLEVLFWAAFTGLLGQANLSKCVGQACGLGWATAALGGVLIQFTIWMAVCTYLEFRAYRESGDNNLGKPILLDQQGEP